MEQILAKGIKELMAEYPQVAETLSKANIGCIECTAGTCLLRDVVEVHGLSYEEERALFAGIAEIIFPGRDVEIPRLERKLSGRKEGIKYSPPIKTLVEEHSLIKRLLALIPAMVNTLDCSNSDDREVVLAAVEFIRSYADKYHHAKEEDILFRLFDDELEILKAMHEEHRIGRGFVKAVLEGLERQDNASVAANLLGYGELLASHIRKEDEVLYPWMDEKLSSREIGILFSRFTETDQRFRETAIKQESFINKIEQEFAYKEEKEYV